MIQKGVDLKFTEPELAKCDRCGRYVFTCWSAGLSVTVDTAPLDANRYRAWLIAKLFTYDAKKNSIGKITMLKPRNQFSEWGTYDVLGQHPCSVSQVTSTSFEAPPAPKDSPPASFSSAKKVFVRDYSKGKRVTPARNATRPLSRPARCDACRRRVYVSDPDVISIEHATYIWAIHLECP